MASLGHSDTGLIPEKLTEYQFKVIIWTFTITAFPFVPFRLCVRWKVFHRLFVDDAFVVLGFLLLLTYTSIWSNRANDLYAVFDVGAGYTKPGPDFLSHLDRFRTAELAAVILYGCCLWSIKAAFLLFFRRLGNQVNHQRTIWWCIVAWNVATFIVFLGVRNWRCTANSTKYTVAHCADVATAKFSQRALEIQTAMDVLSDASMFIIPMTLLWKVQMTTRKKLALGVIFSLTIFIMAASITRVLIVNQKNSSIDETWMDSWSVIEMSIAVIVACLASFRALFTSQTISQRLPDYNGRDPERRALHNKRRIGWSSTSLTHHEEPHRLESALTRPTTFQVEKPNSALTPVYILNLNLNPHPQPFTSPLIIQSPLPPFELFLHAQSTKGCNVFVTSSSAEKIARAIALGAKGGVDYTDEGGWAKKLQKLLPRGRPFLDRVIDGAGGDIVGTTWKLLKMGAAIVNYGMTGLEQPVFPMQAVMKNVELKGSTMGSRGEFGEMVQFVRKKRIWPAVDRVVDGIENLEDIEGLFEDMRKGRHFGKLVVRIKGDRKEYSGGSKL